MRNIFFILFFYSLSCATVFTSPLDTLKSKMDSDKASKLIRKGDFENAVNLYEKAISKNSNSTELYYNLGSALISRGENQNAIEVLNLAKKTFTDKTSDKLKNYVYYNSGIAAIEEKNYKLAINELVEALTYNPKDDNARYALEYARKRDKEENSAGGENSQNNNSESDNKNEKNNSDGSYDNDDKNDEKNNLESDNKLDSQQKNEKNTEESLTEEDIERLLNSLRNLRKEPKNNEDNYGGYIEKDW